MNKDGKSTSSSPCFVHFEQYFVYYLYTLNDIAQIMCTFWAIMYMYIHFEQYCVFHSYILSNIVSNIYTFEQYCAYYLYICFEQYCVCIICTLWAILCDTAQYLGKIWPVAPIRAYTVTDSSWKDSEQQKSVVVEQHKKYRTGSSRSHQLLHVTSYIAREGFMLAIALSPPPSIPHAPLILPP